MLYKPYSIAYKVLMHDDQKLGRATYGAPWVASALGCAVRLLNKDGMPTWGPSCATYAACPTPHTTCTGSFSRTIKDWLDQFPATSSSSSTVASRWEKYSSFDAYLSYDHIFTDESFKVLLSHELLTAELQISPYFHLLAGGGYQLEHQKKFALQWCQKSSVWKEKVDRWKASLKDVATLPGFSVSRNNEASVIKEIVSTVRVSDSTMDMDMSKASLNDETIASTSSSVKETLKSASESESGASPTKESEQKLANLIITPSRIKAKPDFNCCQVDLFVMGMSI
ncbi:hypothetical protein L6452_26718 [Arctium lappa]|uniref:Uncharacterized protein n=1 Tax=Arctium lappa TaxID=4217 RepID=A0ACB8ZVH6_ARCLA|nr:hypothetical protein L6452_26718 [Arctium lappa]